MKITVTPASRLTQGQTGAWSAIQRAEPALDNPFFCVELVKAVDQVCNNVEVAILEEDGRHVGFFPFQRDGKGNGRPVAWPMSDMHGIVARPDVRVCAAQLIRACGLSVWHFDHLIAGQECFKGHHMAIDDSPYMDLSHGYDAYEEERRGCGSSAVSQANRKSRKIAKEVGPLRLEYHTTEAGTLDALVQWKREQLKRQGHADVFRLKWLPDLLEILKASNSEAFSGVLSALYARDRLIAVHLGLQSYDVLSSWIPAYDDRYARYSPGMILHLEVAKAAAARGIKRIDLCRGYNQLKLSLMSGAFPVAIGSVDRRAVNRLFNKAWFGARKLVYASPLRGAPLKMFRRVKNWAVMR